MPKINPLAKFPAGSWMEVPEAKGANKRPNISQTVAALTT